MVRGSQKCEIVASGMYFFKDTNGKGLEQFYVICQKYQKSWAGQQAK